MFFSNTSFPSAVNGIAGCFCTAWRSCLFVFALFCSLAATAQTKDTSDKVKITIVNSGKYIFNKTDSGEYTKFVTDVILLQGTDTLYCDSVYLNNTTRNFEAFGNVKIAQLGGTQGTSDYLRYTTAQKLAFMRGNVNLTDSKNRLWCEELTYNLGTKTGVYDKGGTLNSDSTTVSSQAGTYNVRTKDARFTGNVIVTDPRYKIKSKDLGYNTETKVETFYAHSVVTSDSGKSVLMTSGGTYDSKNVIAHFIGHSSIWNDGQYIEADTLNYNSHSGYGFAHGNVISIDTAQHSTIYCGHAEYYRRRGVLWATIKPVLEQVNGKDTLYMRADTFYSAPMVRLKNVASKTIILKDTIGIPEVMPFRIDSFNLSAVHKTDTVKTDSIKGSKQVHTASAKPSGKKPAPAAKAKVKTAKTKAPKQPPLAVPKPAMPVQPEGDFTWVTPEGKYRMADFAADTMRIAKLRATGMLQPADTALADSTAPVFFLGYHHVLIFSDSLQGKCDSVVYTRSDSMIRMIYAPIAWAHNSQITGDTILMQLDSSHIKSMYVPNNALLVSQSGPDRAHLWDQVQGKTLTAYFKDNEISKMVVMPNSESIYYSKDDAGAYVGVMQSKSERMRIFFHEQKIRMIRFELDAHHTLTPMEKADLPNTKLSRFKWLIDQRPKTKEELFQ